MTKFPAVELNDPKDLAGVSDWKSERAVQSVTGGRVLSWKAWILRHIATPTRLAAPPNTAGKTNAVGKDAFAGDLLKFQELAGGIVPEVRTTDRTAAAVHCPKRAKIPIETFADDLEDVRRCFRHAAGFGQNHGHRVLRAQALLRTLAIGDIDHRADHANRP